MTNHDTTTAAEHFKRALDELITASGELIEAATERATVDIATLEAQRGAKKGGDL